MSGLWTIYRRELKGLFQAPWSWLLLSVALFINAFFILVPFLRERGGDVDQALRFLMGGSVPFWAIMMFFPPLVTMRMISEEARTGILEFLLTAPVTDAALVTGKFLAATTFMAFFWASALVYALLFTLLGTAPDWGPVLGGYLGAVLTSGLFCATGLLASAGTATPVLAAFLAFAFNLMWLMLPLLSSLTSAAWVQETIGSVDVIGHFQRSFLVGVFDTAEVTFFVAWTLLFVFFSVRAVETRRWR